MKESSLQPSEHGALLSAAYIGDYDEALRLIQGGHDVNERDENGATPLIYAADANFFGTNMLELLIYNGAEISACDNDGNTALDYTRYRGNNEAADLLQKHGAMPREGLSPVEQDYLDYCTQRCEQNQRYLDDRMYVFEVSFGGAGPVASTEHQDRWLVITRRNAARYVPVRIDSFHTRQEAVDHLKAIAPRTPRVSLGGASPSPVPSWKEFQQWLADMGLERLPY